MILYQTLSSFKPLRKSYTLKFLFVAFIGIHVPLIGIIVYIAFSAIEQVNPSQIVIITLLLTLAATAVTLYLLNKLLKPVGLAKKSLDEYIQHNKIPDLPTNYRDEVGVLLRCIQQTIHSLEDANRIKDDLMHTITHDLRSPLTQIIGLSNLYEHSDKEEHMNLVKTIKKCAEQEMDFIANYIAIIETQHLSDNYAQIVVTNLSELSQKVIDKLSFQLEAKRLTLEKQIDSTIFMGTPSPALLEHVIQNLLTNAIKFSYPDATIRFEAALEPSNIKIRITDNGIGFNSADAEKMFIKFTPHKRLGTLNEGTNGIGLYLTSEIVKIHKGKIWAISEGENKGAQFHVEFPRKNDKTF